MRTIKTIVAAVSMAVFAMIGVAATPWAQASQAATTRAAASNPWFCQDFRRFQATPSWRNLDEVHWDSGTARRNQKAAYRVWQTDLLAGRGPRVLKSAAEAVTDTCQ